MLQMPFNDFAYSKVMNRSKSMHQFETIPEPNWQYLYPQNFMETDHT